MLNSCLNPFGMGAFHCGVEVYGHEWSYAENVATGTHRQRTGIFASQPCTCEGHSYSKSVNMGRTGASAEEVLQLLRLLSHTWQANSYNFLTRNCCHFCNDLCQRLGVGAVPSWVVSLADAGADIIAFGDITCCKEVAGQTCTEAERIFCIDDSPEVELDRIYYPDNEEEVLGLPASCKVEVVDSRRRKGTCIRL